MLTLRSPSDFQELGESALDFREAITLIQRAIIIIPTGITGGRTTLILSHTRIITAATDIPGITGLEGTTATIAIIIATTIELTSLSELWK
jgi:alanine-alpha-ketoisovalerate/valine-pyruvate aminotransferase